MKRRFLLIMLLALAGPLLAESVTLKKGLQYGNTLSGILDEVSGSGFGTAPTLNVGDTNMVSRVRFVIKFDSIFAAVPAGVIVTGTPVCSLSIHNIYLSDSLKIAAYRILESWDWDSAGYHKPPWWPNRTTSLTWSNPGCGNGTSAASISEGDSLAVFGNSAWQWIEVPLSAATLQAWIDTPTVNNGVMIRALESGTMAKQRKQFVSPHHDSANLYPKLYFEYQLPGMTQHYAKTDTGYTSFAVRDSVSGAESLDSVCLYVHSDSAVLANHLADSLRRDIATSFENNACTLECGGNAEGDKLFFLLISYDGDVSPAADTTALDWITLQGYVQFTVDDVWSHSTAQALLAAVQENTARIDSLRAYLRDSILRETDTLNTNLCRIRGSAFAADNLLKFFDGTGYNAVMSTIGIVSTVNNIAPGGITAGSLADGLITAAKLAANCITSDEIAASGVTELQAGLSTFNPATSAVHLAGDSTHLLAQRLKWLLLYTGAEPGMVQVYYPIGGDPKDSVKTAGQTYRIRNYKNPANPGIIDSSKVIE